MDFGRRRGLIRSRRHSHCSNCSYHSYRGCRHYSPMTLSSCQVEIADYFWGAADSRHRQNSHKFQSPYIHCASSRYPGRKRDRARYSKRTSFRCKVFVLRGIHSARSPQNKFGHPPDKRSVHCIGLRHTYPHAYIAPDHRKARCYFGSRSLSMGHKNP